MKYNTIYNDPTPRSRVSNAWSYWDDGFTNEELQKIIDYCESEGTHRGTIFSGNQEETERVRKSNVKFHSRNDSTAWIFDRLNFIIQATNERFYNFDLNGYESFQYTTYNADEQGEYNWHMDMCLNHMPDNMYETRKLSMTLQLNDEYEGGEFQINNGDEAGAVTPEMKKGRALFFPSFMCHRVKPVTKGIRRSLVVWVVGPKFI